MGPPPATRLAPRGMVCAVDHLAATAGLRMLDAGGTAADAAVAASAVLAVTTQHMCGMGGDLFALVHAPGDHRPAALQASGFAGSGADPERLRAEGRTAMPFRGDIRSVPVPGCVDGWLALHDRFGRLPLAVVLDPARRYAEEGFPASHTLAASIPLIADLPGAGDYRAAVRNGRVSAGALVRRPGVAAALRSIAQEGRPGFYEGPFGKGLLALGRGEFAAGDLATTQAVWVEPLAVDTWGVRLWTVPPPSQGYLTLASAVIASSLPLPDEPADPLWAHLLVEAARVTGFDRPSVLSETAPGRDLLHPDRLARRRAMIDADAAAAGPGERYAEGGTVFLCAVDEDRMGVSLIQSNAAGWGAHIVEPATGVFLQNRGMGFSLQPGHPAEYGPRRRPPHTLSPALVTTEREGDVGALRMVIGTMGGDSQPQILLQLLARLLVAGESPGRAVSAGRWVLAGAAPGGTGFDTWSDGGDVRVVLEDTSPEGWDGGLRGRGHRVERQPSGHGFGHAHVIAVAGDHLAGASDHRALDGTAAGM